MKNVFLIALLIAIVQGAAALDTAKIDQITGLPHAKVQRV